MAIKIFVICDQCGTEMDESKKAGWISYENSGIFVFEEGKNKTELKGNNSLFCSPECMTKWIQKGIDKINTKSVFMDKVIK